MDYLLVQIPFGVSIVQCLLCSLSKPMAAGLIFRSSILQCFGCDYKLRSHLHDLIVNRSLNSNTVKFSRFCNFLNCCKYEPRHDKTNEVSVRPVKTQISLGIWSEPSLSAWRKLGSLATNWVHSEDWSDWADAQADLSLHWAHTHFVGFVMSQLILFCSVSEGTMDLSVLNKASSSSQESNSLNDNSRTFNEYSQPPAEYPSSTEAVWQTACDSFTGQWKENLRPCESSDGEEVQFRQKFVILMYYCRLEIIWKQQNCGIKCQY